MSDATFCPLLFVPNSSLTPDEIEKYQIKFLDLHLTLCDKYKIRLCFSTKLFDIICSCFPWNLKNDPAWKQYILLWESVVFGPIQKKAIFSNVAEDHSERSEYTYNCQIKDLGDIMSALSDWMHAWLGEEWFRSKVLRGLISDSSRCSENEGNNALCDYYIKIRFAKDYELLLFPWKHLYPHDLPHAGDFPFVPPENWMVCGKAAKGENFGYIDREGNEWMWDKMHKDHWDVQFPSGGYIRITNDGRRLP